MVPLVITLEEAACLDPAGARALLGTKAASLARLLGAGFPVPPGVVVTAAAATDWNQASAQLRTAAAELGGPSQRFAVRSSASAEDLAGASYAGQYETVLDVGLDELPDGVRRVFASATSARVAAYRQAHPEAGAAAAPTGDPSGSGSRMAVLVHVMVAAAAAGVAFTANPLTGARDEVVITAVRGLGERLVAGQATGDQWIVRDSQARCIRATEEAITADQARQIAALARRVHILFASPQDLEWAIATDPAGAEGGLWLLQTRPMMALPVSWTPPAPGYWMRNLRIGEWLPEAMTPLFADWLLERLDHGEQQATRDHVGAALVFPHAAINGWYYLATWAPFCRAAAGCCGSCAMRSSARAATRSRPTGAFWQVWPRSGTRTCCPATSSWSRRVNGRSRPLRPSSWPPSSTRSAPPPASSYGRWPWWAARPGRWKAPWPASPASTSPLPSTSASSGCWPGCPAASRSCPPTPSKASTGPIPPPASWAGRRPHHPTTGTASWPASARPSPPSAWPCLATGHSSRRSSRRCSRWPSGMPGSASNKPASSPSAGPCCAAAYSASARPSRPTACSTSLRTCSC